MKVSVEVFPFVFFYPFRFDRFWFLSSLFSIKKFLKQYLTRSKRVPKKIFPSFSQPVDGSLLRVFFMELAS